MDVTDLVADGQEDAIAEARFLGNIFLNKLSWRYDRHLEIAWPMRVTHILLSGQEDVKDIEPPIVYSGSIEIQFGARDPTQLGKIEVWRSQAAYYYRRSQLAFDPFDIFRNLYLVTENIASKIYKKKAHEKEQVELERALSQCFAKNPESLKETAKATPAFDSKNETISEVVRILYKANRCQLNHSKAYGELKVPFNYQDEKDVTDALPLMKFVAKSFLIYEESSL